MKMIEAYEAFSLLWNKTARNDLIKSRFIPAKTSPKVSFP